MKTMKQLFVIITLLDTVTLNAQELTVEQHLEDFDIVVRQVEENYSGFTAKVDSLNHLAYINFKAELRGQVGTGAKRGRDVGAEYTAFFADYHLFITDGGFNCTQEYMPKHKQIPHYWDSIEYHPSKLACKVTDRTFLIRFPSCSGDPTIDWVKESIKSYLQSGCDNLIIDIRGNNGGQDTYYKPYLELLYDHMGTTEGVEFYNSEANREACIQVAESRGNPEWLTSLIKRLKESENNTFVIWDEETSSIEYDSISSKPIKAAIIIDRLVSSSAEQMLLELKATSHRTTIYGQDNTLGCIDFSNTRPAAQLPNCKAMLYIPMTRSVRIAKGISIDETGIKPDVRIKLPLPKNLTDIIDEWTVWVAHDLEKE